MDWIAFFTGLGIFVTSLATLVTAMRTHSAVKTSDGQTIGSVIEQATTPPEKAP